MEETKRKRGMVDMVRSGMEENGGWRKVLSVGESTQRAQYAPDYAIQASCHVTAGYGCR